MYKYNFTLQYANKSGEPAEIMLFGSFYAESKYAAERITNEICEVYKKNGLVEPNRIYSMPIVELPL